MYRLRHDLPDNEPRGGGNAARFVSFPYRNFAPPFDPWPVCALNDRVLPPLLGALGYGFGAKKQPESAMSRK